MFLENVFFKFCNIFLVGASQKNPFFALGNWKMIFPWKENEKFLRQHCWRCQDTRMCPIWAYLSKLYHECGHNIRHLALKPWIFTDDSSFLRTLFQENWRIPSLYFFVLTRSHIMTPREGFPFIWFFLNFVCRFQ